VQAVLRQQVLAGPRGPSADERRRGSAFVWGEAEDSEGHRVVSRLVTPEGYTVTAHAALAAVEGVLAGAAPSGYQTPASAFGADFILGIEGVSRSDETPLT
jgi:saccharopine dehydrogenase (NAD+, L-lysine-forming)